MAGSVNKVILVGRLGADPELRYTPSGMAVANFNIATDDVWTDRKSGERQERTEWHRIVVWQKLAETCAEYLKKGHLVYIEGRLQTRSWEDKESIKRYTTEIVARNMQMLESRRAAEAPAEAEEEAFPPPGGPPEPAAEEDDLPF